MRTPRPTALAALLAAALASAVLGGCSDEPTLTGDTRPEMSATGTPSPAVQPAQVAPRDTRKVRGDGFELAAPSEFQQKDRKASNGEPMLVLEHASSVEQLPARVVVLREPKAQQDVVEQSYALEVTKRTVAKAKDVSRSDVDWPGAQRAVLVQWTESVTIKGGRAVPVRYWQLNTQVSKDLILVVVGLAPEKDFPTSGVAEVFSTFRPNA